MHRPADVVDDGAAMRGRTPWHLKRRVQKKRMARDLPSLLRELARVTREIIESGLYRAASPVEAGDLLELAPGENGMMLVQKAVRLPGGETADLVCSSAGAK